MDLDQRLCDLGARRVLVTRTGPLGCSSGISHARRQKCRMLRGATECSSPSAVGVGDFVYLARDPISSVLTVSSSTLHPCSCFSVVAPRRTLGVWWEKVERSLRRNAPLF